MALRLTESCPACGATDQLQIMEKEEQRLVRVQCLRCFGLFLFNLDDRSLTATSSRVDEKGDA